jgi:hypothetical protein
MLKGENNNIDIPALIRKFYAVILKDTLMNEENSGRGKGGKGGRV